MLKGLDKGILKLLPRTCLQSSYDFYSGRECWYNFSTLVSEVLVMRHLSTICICHGVQYCILPEQGKYP